MSSLGQVLLSIQTQLLVSDPYFNEPGYDRTRGTPQGDDSSKRYNNNLRLATLRHAIVSPLREPPKGLEEVVKRHFGMCRQRVLLQAKIWTKEAKGTPLYPRFVKVYKELLVLLSSDSLKGFNCLPPPAKDIMVVSNSDANLLPEFEYILQAAGEKASKRNVPESMQSPVVSHQAFPPQGVGATSNASSEPSNQTTISQATYNPWAAGGVATPASAPNGKGDDEDDELYI